MKIYQLIMRIAVTWVAFILVILLMSACRSVVEVPVDRIKLDSIYIKQLERDSVYVRDSVYIIVRADTVFKTKTQWRFRDRILRDTLYKMRTDTVAKLVSVEKPLTEWERVKMSAGGYAIVCGAILIAIWFAKRLKGL